MSNRGDVEGKWSSIVAQMNSGRFFVGQRVILDDRHLGTVRFSGRVEGQDPEQIWLGIEWDDPTRGKHSGQFKNGPILFRPLSVPVFVVGWFSFFFLLLKRNTDDLKSCFNFRIPNSATFIKPSARLGAGRSFLKALKEKYLDQELLSPDSHLSAALHIAQNEENAMRKVALRFSCLDRLRLIGLEFSRINGAGNELEVAELDGLLTC